MKVRGLPIDQHFAVDPADWRDLQGDDDDNENDEDRPASASVKMMLGFDPDDLWLAQNAFCPTGEDGGVDPTCSPLAGHIGKTYSFRGQMWTVKKVNDDGRYFVQSDKGATERLTNDQVEKKLGIGSKEPKSDNLSFAKGLFKDASRRGISMQDAIVYPYGNVDAVIQSIRDGIKKTMYKEFGAGSLDDPNNKKVKDGAELNFRLGDKGGKELNVYIRTDGKRTAVFFDETAMDEGGKLHTTPMVVPTWVRSAITQNSINQNNGCGGGDDLSGGHWEEKDGGLVYVRPGKLTADDIIARAGPKRGAPMQNWAGGDGLGPTAQGVPDPRYVNADDGAGRDLTSILPLGGGDKPSEDDRLQRPDVDTRSRPTPQPSPAQRQVTPGDDQSGKSTRRGPKWGSGMGGGTA